MILSQQNKGVLALVLLSFGFGAIAIIARVLGSQLHLFQQLYLTLGAGMILSLPFSTRILKMDRLTIIPFKDWLIMIFRIVVGYVVGGSLYRESVLLTKISNVVFIQALPFVAIFGWILLKEKFNWQKLILVMLSYLGVVIISVKDFSSIFTIGKGELFSFISAALFSLSYISRKWQTDFLDDKEISQILLILGTVILFITSLLFGEGLPKINWSIFLLLLVFLNGFINAFNLFFTNFGFRYVKAVLASNILTLESIFAVILAIIFFREIPTSKELIGGILIIGSVLQMNRLENK